MVKFHVASWAIHPAPTCKKKLGFGTRVLVVLPPLTDKVM